jgi:endoglucanase
MKNALAIFLAFVLSASVLCSAETISLSPRLEVKGNLLVYAGQPIRLRGVAIGDVLKPGRPATYNFKSLREAWNVNVVRLSVHPGYWEVNPEAGRWRLETLVGAARAEGIFVIICWHAIGFPDGLVRKPKPEWHSLENAFDTSFVKCRAFWRQMAGKYGADGGVLFELFNEPVCDPKHLDDEPQHWPELRNYWTILLKEDIRPLAQNVAICAATRWTSNLTGVRENPVPDSQVAYTWHVYPRKKGGRDFWPANVAEVYKDLPMFVTEWGFCEGVTNQFTATPDSFALPLIQFMEERGMNWIAYNYGATSLPNLLEKDWSTPTKSGKFVQNQLKRFPQTFSSNPKP